MAAAQKIITAKGRVFNIVNGYDNPQYADVTLKSAQLAGYKGILFINYLNVNYIILHTVLLFALLFINLFLLILGEVHWEPRTHWMHDVVDATVILSPSAAIQFLGWTPKIFGFLVFIIYIYYKFLYLLLIG